MLSGRPPEEVVTVGRGRGPGGRQSRSVSGPAPATTASVPPARRPWPDTVRDWIRDPRPWPPLHDPRRAGLAVDASVRPGRGDSSRRPAGRRGRRHRPADGGHPRRPRVCAPHRLRRSVRAPPAVLRLRPRDDPTHARPPRLLARRDPPAGRCRRVPPVDSPPHWVSAFTWCCWSGCSGNGSRCPECGRRLRNPLTRPSRTPGNDRGHRRPRGRAGAQASRNAVTSSTRGS